MRYNAAAFSAAGAAMEEVAVYALPRVVHLLSVVLWIGGVGLVATVVLPLLMQGDDHARGYRFFQDLARRFAWQARVTTLLVGVSGFYLLHLFGFWGRLSTLSSWWIWLMIALWIFFTVVLFVLLPRANRRGADRVIPENPGQELRSAYRLHWVLLVLSLVTVAAGVSGAHGWLWGIQ